MNALWDTRVFGPRDHTGERLRKGCGLADTGYTKL